MSPPPKNTLAVALHYEQAGTTPRVVAKGKGEIGQKIIETARQHGVPIEENASLAGALSEVEIGDEIPVELYKAVAEVLLFIMRMSGRLKAHKPESVVGN
jgi:flagellar biosynthesis protein